MNAVEALATPKKFAKSQTAAIYKRHGSGDNVFGALTSEIAKLQKKIKVDHTLAMELWRTGNADARLFALQVSDPQWLTRADADQLLRDGRTHFLGCYLAGLVSRSPIAREIMRSWMTSSDESTREMEYSILSLILNHEPESVSDADAGEIVKTIENEIHACELGSVRDERRAHFDRSLQAFLPKKGHRCRKAHRQGSRRPRRDTCETPDAIPHIEQGFQAQRPLVICRPGADTVRYRKGPRKVVASESIADQGQSFGRGTSVPRKFGASLILFPGRIWSGAYVC